MVFEWFIDKFEYLIMFEGEFFFEFGMKVDYMFMILEGEIGVWFCWGNFMKDFGFIKKGVIMGVLFFLRMKLIMVEGKVIKEVYFLSLYWDYFVEMVNVSYDLM